MEGLWIYLPPFASDIAGAAAALYDLGGLLVICDPGCCTETYAFWEEPRWQFSPGNLVSARLRSLQAVLGDDEGLIRRVCEAAEALGSSSVALIGTPVPAVTGMDIRGLARAVEARLGIPAFGVPTTGFRWYDRGLFLAGRALLDIPKPPAGPVKGRLNILGLNPMDHGAGPNGEDLASFLAGAGWTVGCRSFRGLRLEDFAAVAAAEVNLAVSAAGLALARELEKRYGTPCVPGFPMGRAHGAYLLSGKPFPDGKKRGGERLLLVGDQVLMSSLRQALELRGTGYDVSVASFFTWDARLARPGDVSLRGEEDYLALLEKGGFSALLGDPLLLDVPPAEGLRRLPLSHPAVSGSLDREAAMRFLSPEFESFLESI